MRLALAVAGQQGARMRDTWMADLVGAPEDGLTLSRWGRIHHAAGFVVAALRIRSRALSAPLWRPVDWVLASDDRTNGVIATLVGPLAIYISATEGLHSLIVAGLASCGTLWACLYGAARWLRKRRGIELAMSGHDSDEM
jgi:hypothetical protein